ncbi:MAG: hypothetical protein H0V44_09760 [Planctomycetes bacterium]|nr:hypothetical protein [Planctomycetota bacterium]
MFSLLFFRAEDDQPIALEEMADVIAAIPGMRLEGSVGAAYRPGRWRDVMTGAACIVDLGEPPLEQDPMHPPRAYAGWRALPLSLNIPLAGPHWFCVEALRVADAILEAFPGVHALDTEDTIAEADAEPGPFTWNRMRALASWEHQRDARCEALGDIPAMHRLASVAMWRYRRERAAGRDQHRRHVWPDAMALRDASDRSALSAAFFRDPGTPMAVPPVDLLIVQRDGETGVLPASEVITAAGGGTPAGIAQAVLIEPNAGLATFLREASILPTSAFSALGDEDWRD